MKFLQLLILFTLTVPATTSAQSEVDWLKQNMIGFSLDSSKDEIREFESIKKSIGNSRIVLLGEESHGDGTTFETKVKLVKFLHKRMGFTVLAFESNQFNAERAWQDVIQNKSPLTALQNSTHPIWGKANEIQPLFEYIYSQSAAKKPLLISGFDCQVEGKYIIKSFKSDLLGYLKEKKIDFTDSAEEDFFFKTFDALIFNKGYAHIKNKSFTEKTAYWDSLKKQRIPFEQLLEKKVVQLKNIKEQKARLFSQFLVSTKGYLPGILYLNAIDKTNKNVLYNLRDSLMADNLVWLVNKYYPKQKIIVWAASYHLAKHKTAGYGNLKETLVGDYIRKELDDKTYTIAFTAYEGNTGWYNGNFLNTIARPKENSFEDLFNKTNKENIFLDLKTNSKTESGKWLLAPRNMRPLGYVEQEKSWPTVFDAVIFNRTMKKVTGIKQ